MATGFFGKLPARGDFVSRGLPPGARPVVDRWLTRMLAPFAREPEDWPEGGLRAMIAHDGQMLALLILPSRDAPGREFPLAAVAAVAETGQPQVDIWADAALPALTQAVAGNLDGDGLIELIGALPLVAGEAPDLPAIWVIGCDPQPPETLLPQIFSSG